MNDIGFQHTYLLTEGEYIEIQTTYMGMRRSWRRLRQALVMVVGVVCLFSAYTLIVGIVLIGVAVVHATMPRWLPVGAARSYRGAKYLHEPITYGINDRGVWMKASDFAAEAGWRHLITWLEYRNLLVLTIHGMPRVVLPIDELRAHGQYDILMSLVRRHGVPFGKRPKVNVNV